MIDWYLTALRKYATFSGRARRQEFWWFTLVNFIVVCGLEISAIMTRGLPSGDPPMLPQPTPLSVVVTLAFVVYVFAIIVPSIAVTVRRLHDTGRSGWWYFIGFVPLVGSLILLIFNCEDSQAGDNQYGPNPKGGVKVVTGYSGS